MQGQLEFGRTERQLHFLELDFGLHEGEDTVEESRLAWIVAEALGELLGKGAQHADEEISDLHALSQTKVLRQVDIKHLDVIVLENGRQTQQLGGLAGPAIAGEEIGPGACGEIDLVC